MGGDERTDSMKKKNIKIMILTVFVVLCIAILGISGILAKRNKKIEQCENSINISSKSLETVYEDSSIINGDYENRSDQPGVKTIDKDNGIIKSENGEYYAIGKGYWSERYSFTGRGVITIYNKSKTLLGEFEVDYIPLCTFISNNGNRIIITKGTIDKIGPFVTRIDIYDFSGKLIASHKICQFLPGIEYSSLSKNGKYYALSHPCKKKEAFLITLFDLETGKILFNQQFSNRSKQEPVSKLGPGPKQIKALDSGSIFILSADRRWIQSKKEYDDCGRALITIFDKKGIKKFESDEKEAIEYLDEKLKDEPELIGAFNELVEKRYSSDPHNIDEFYIRVSDAHKKIKDYDRALSSLKEYLLILQQDPKQNRQQIACVWFKMGELHELYLKIYEDAIDYYRGVLNYQYYFDINEVEKNEELVLRIAKCYLKNKDKGGMVSFLKSVLPESPRTATEALSFYHLGKAKYEFMRLKEAQKNIEKSITIFRNIRSEKFNEELKEAFKDSEAMIDLISDIQWKYARTEDLMADYSYERAEKILMDIISENPKEFEAYMRLATLYHKASDLAMEKDDAYSRTIEILKKGCAYDPPNIDEFYIQIATAYIHMVENESAMEYCKKVLALNVQNEFRCHAARSLSHYYIDSGNKEDLLSYLNDYLECLESDYTEKTEWTKKEIKWVKSNITSIEEEK